MFPWADGGGSRFFPGSSLHGADRKSQPYCDDTLYPCYIDVCFSHFSASASASSRVSSGCSCCGTCNWNQVCCWQPSMVESRVSRQCSFRPVVSLFLAASLQTILHLVSFFLFSSFSLRYSMHIYFLKISIHLFYQTVPWEFVMHHLMQSLFL